MTVIDAYDDDDEEPREPAERRPQLSDRSRGVALGLGIFGGVFGLHRFYVGKIKTGVAMICTLGGLGVWWLYDLVLLAAGEFRDANDLPLRRWGIEETPGLARPRARAERRVEELEDELDGLRGQVSELAERMDFAERLLTQQREPPRQLPRG